MKIEGDKVSAAEVAHHLEVLKGNIAVRKRENYMDPSTETEMMNLLAATEEYDDNLIHEYFIKFYGKWLNILFHNRCLITSFLSFR